MKKIKDFFNNEPLQMKWALALSLPALLMSGFGWPKLPFDPVWIAVILCGVPIIAEAVEALVTSFNIRTYALEAVALIALVAHGDTLSAGMAAFVLLLGRLLESLALRRAGSGIEKLAAQRPRMARVRQNGEERAIPADAVKAGDILRVIPGDIIAADGIVISGETAVDESLLTDEPQPAEKTVGDEVKSGTENRLGAFDMRAARDAEHSTLQRIARYTKAADTAKLKSVAAANGWAAWLVILALAAAAVMWLTTRDFTRAVSILIASCPCALCLAARAAVTAAVGNVTQRGVIVRKAGALERLPYVTDAVFGKTGTLTLGNPEVTDVSVYMDGLTENDVLRCAALAEKRSEHLLGKAVVRAFRERFGKLPAEPDDFSTAEGRGVAARTYGHTILAGNAAMLAAAGLTPPVREDDAGTVIYVAMDGRLVGSVTLTDRLRETTAMTMSSVVCMGVRPILLSGDREAVARAVAEGAGIRDYRAGCLPDDKLAEIRRMQHDGRKVCMIGGGVNDAPAMSAAWTGIAAGADCSGSAVEAADIVFIKNDIQQFPHLVAVSRQMKRVMRGSVIFTVTVSVAAAALAAVGILGPVTGALAQCAAGVIAVHNASRLARWEKKS